jgi:hypothetical protein
MQNIKYIPIIIAILMIINSCEEVIDVDLNNVNPQIVIEGEITDKVGPYFVKISKTGNFFEENKFPAISGAKIYISDSEGIIDTLTETSQGIYKTNKIIGKVGNTYKLKIELDGNIYESQAKMLNPTLIDSITYNFNSNTGPGQGKKGGYDLHCFFKDKPGIIDYCMIKLYVNGIKDKSYFLYTGKLNKDETVDYNRFRKRFEKNDTIKIELSNLEFQGFDYFSTLNDIMSSEGMRGIVSTGTPANPNTNIKGGALGYFLAYTVSSDSVIVK